jgi:hypothetical protein
MAGAEGQPSSYPNRSGEVNRKRFPFARSRTEMDRGPVHEPLECSANPTAGDTAATSGLDPLGIALPPGCLFRLVDRLRKNGPAELARFPGNMTGTTLSAHRRTPRWKSGYGSSSIAQIIRWIRGIRLDAFRTARYRPGRLRDLSMQDRVVVAVLPVEERSSVAATVW